jgi:hypothetical protein
MDLDRSAYLSSIDGWKVSIWMEYHVSLGELDK